MQLNSTRRAGELQASQFLSQDIGGRLAELGFSFAWNADYGLEVLYGRERSLVIAQPSGGGLQYESVAGEAAYYFPGSATNTGEPGLQIGSVAATHRMRGNPAQWPEFNGAATNRWMLLWRSAIDTSVGTAFPRVAEVSTGTNATNGWGMMYQTSNNTWLLAADGTSRYVSSTVASADRGNSRSWALAKIGPPGRYYREGAKFGSDGSSTFVFPVSAATPGNIGNWPFATATSRQWRGHIHYVYTAAPANFAEADWLAERVAADPLFFEPRWGERTYFIPAATGADHNLLAEDLTSTPTLTEPTLGQVHALAADDLSTTATLGTPALGQTHALAADDLTSTPTLGTPALTTEGTDALLADDLATTPSLSTPALGQVHALTAEDLSSAPTLSEPVLALGPIVLYADDLEIVITLPQPQLGQVHALTAADISITAALSLPALDGDEDATGMLYADVSITPALRARAQVTAALQANARVTTALRGRVRLQ